MALPRDAWGRPLGSAVGTLTGPLPAHRHLLATSGVALRHDGRQPAPHEFADSRLVPVLGARLGSARLSCGVCGSGALLSVKEHLQAVFTSGSVERS